MLREERKMSVINIIGTSSFTTQKLSLHSGIL